MTQVFKQFLTDLIEENILESSDEELIENLDKVGHSTTNDISHARDIIKVAVAQSRKSRLQTKANTFSNWKKTTTDTIRQKIKKTTDEMISEIAIAMTSNQENISEDLSLMAFRNQNKKPSDEDIESLYNDFVSLGLINSEDE